MSLRRIHLAKRLKSFKRLCLIPRFCDFGISSTLDAVLRYLPIFFAVLRYLSIFSAVLRCSAPPNVPLFKVVANSKKLVAMTDTHTHKNHFYPVTVLDRLNCS